MKKKKKKNQIIKENIHVLICHCNISYACNRHFTSKAFEVCKPYRVYIKFITHIYKYPSDNKFACRRFTIHAMHETHGIFYTLKVGNRNPTSGFFPTAVENENERGRRGTNGIRLPRSAQ